MDFLEYIPKKTYKTKNFETQQNLNDSLGDHKISFISSVKGTLQITVDGFPFTRHRVKDSTVYWRCVQFKSLGCKARLRSRFDPNVPFENNYDTLDQKVEIVQKDHNHEIITERRKKGSLKHLQQHKKQCSYIELMDLQEFISDDDIIYDEEQCI